jgi:hypothetical protein
MMTLQLAVHEKKKMPDDGWHKGAHHDSQPAWLVGTVTHQPGLPRPLQDFERPTLLTHQLMLSWKDKDEFEQDTVTIGAIYVLRPFRALLKIDNEE